jgi:hypothetical protein
MNAMIFVVPLTMWCLSLFGQQSPAAGPVLEELRRRGDESATTDVSYAASQTLNLKLIHSKAIVSRLNLYFMVLCIMTS